MRFASPVTDGKVVVNSVYVVGVVPAAGAVGVVPGAGVVAGAGIAVLNVPVMVDPVIVTLATFPFSTWSMKLLYGKVTSGVPCGRKTRRFQTSNASRITHHIQLNLGFGGVPCGLFWFWF